MKKASPGAQIVYLVLTALVFLVGAVVAFYSGANGNAFSFVAGVLVMLIAVFGTIYYYHLGYLTVGRRDKRK